MVFLKFKINGAKLYIDEKPVLENEIFLDTLGSGANAVVFRSYNTLLKREEAIKIWKPRKGHNDVDVKRYLSEIEKNASFNNDCIAKVYEAGIINKCYYLKMEYCMGVTLRDYLSNKPVYCERLRVLSSIVSTMYDVYLRGEHHGDLHSRNIIINNCEVKILDFGTSVFVKEKELSYKRDATMLFDLAIEILPELKEVDFFYNKVREKSSIEICECIIYLIELLCLEMRDYGDTPYDFYIAWVAIMAKTCTALSVDDVKTYFVSDASIYFEYVKNIEFNKNIFETINKNNFFLRNILANDLKKMIYSKRDCHF